MGVGLGGTATYLYMRQQQQRTIPRALVDAVGGFAGAASHPALKHGAARVRLFAGQHLLLGAAPGRAAAASAPPPRAPTATALRRHACG